MVLSAAWVVFNINDSVYIGLRKSEYVLVKQSVFSVAKLVLPWLFLGLGFFGIFGSYSISLSSSIISLLAYFANLAGRLVATLPPYHRVGQ